MYIVNCQRLVIWATMQWKTQIEVGHERLGMDDEDAGRSLPQPAPQHPSWECYRGMQDGTMQPFPWLVPAHCRSEMIVHPSWWIGSPQMGVRTNHLNYTGLNGVLNFSRAWCCNVVLYSKQPSKNLSRAPLLKFSSTKFNRSISSCKARQFLSDTRSSLKGERTSRRLRNGEVLSLPLFCGHRWLRCPSASSHSAKRHSWSNPDHKISW